MQKYWNGKSNPVRGQLYLDEDSQLCALIECVNGSFIGKMIEHPDWGEHALPALSITDHNRIRPVRCHLSEWDTRTLEQITQDTVALIDAMRRYGYFYLDINIVRRSTGADLYSETEHIEALLMNRVFDRDGDFRLVENAQSAVK